MSTDDFTKDYRQTMGLFATGVTVVLAERGGEVRGMTANAITSLSLDPPLLLFCPAKSSRMGQHVQIGCDFTVNILGDHQEDVSNWFAAAQEGEAPASVQFVDWPEAGTAPRLDDCMAHLGCRVRQVLEGGDHYIVVGEVRTLSRTEEPGNPLMFFNSRYHRP